MKSALQLELQDLHGLPFIASIIWVALLFVCLLGIAFFLFQRAFKKKPVKVPSSKEFNRKNPKGF